MQTHQLPCSFCLLFGRIALSAIFILAGVGKFLDFEGTSKFMEAAGLPNVPILLIIAAIVEILGGLLLFFGYRARLGAVILLLFLIPTTYFFHNFWDLEGLAKQVQLVEFLKNLAIFGGLLYVLGAGAGKISIDGCRSGSCTSCNKE